MDDSFGNNDGSKSSNRVSSALLMTVKNSFEAELYIDMLRQSGVAAITELADPIGAYLNQNEPSMGKNKSTEANIYVQEPQLEMARKLVNAFESKPIVYHEPPPKLNQISKANRAVYAVLMFFLLVVPLGAALFYLLYKIISSLMSA